MTEPTNPGAGKSPYLTPDELDVLKEIAGEKKARPWGAAVAATYEVLRHRGLVSSQGLLTQRGRDFLQTVRLSEVAAAGKGFTKSLWRDAKFGQPVGFETVGFLVHWLSETDPRSAKDQLHHHYQHGGGWCKFEGFKMDPNDYSLRYPGDPAHRPRAIARLRDELVIFYNYSWVAIVQPDKTFEVARMD